MDVRIRRATADDLDRVIEIHFSSFPDSRGAEARRRQFESNVFGPMSDLFVVERLGGTDPTVIGHALLHELEAWFGGKRVRLGGIESVGIAPEARGQGIAGKLLDHLHAQSAARGDALTMLYVFGQGFYRRLGYVPVTPMCQLEISPSAIPPAWTRAARGAMRLVNGDDRRTIEAIYEQRAAVSHGWVRRPPSYWEARLLDPRTAWFLAENHRGYVSWSLEQAELHAPILMVVGELVSLDDATERLLWGHLGAQRDQVRAIEIDVPWDDPIMLALTDIDRHRLDASSRIEHRWGTLHSSGMIRMHDAKNALEARGYATSGSLTVGLGPHAYRLDVADGSASVRDHTGAVDLFFPEAATLAMVAFGGVRPSQAARAGLVEARDPHALKLADSIFSTSTFHAREPF